MKFPHLHAATLQNPSAVVCRLLAEKRGNQNSAYLGRLKRFGSERKRVTPPLFFTNAQSFNAVSVKYCYQLYEQREWEDRLHQPGHTGTGQGRHDSE
jgi:hypothetical protein